MKAVLYARVSSREQEKEGFSIPAQVKLLEEYAQKNKLLIVEHFTEAETAKQSGREEFTRMLEYVRKSKEPLSILVEKTDRLYRNFKDYVRLEELDAEIHLVKEGEVLSKDSKSHVKFIHGIKVLMAKNYIDNLLEEVKKGQKEKAEQGHFPSFAPYGYKNNRDTKLIEVDAEKSLLIKHAFELYATREYSLDTLREKLYQDGFLYQPSTKRVPRGTLEKLLKNQIFMGDFYWADKYYKGKHTPIITTELFEKVQSILDDKSKGQRTTRDFQFTGLLNCAVCGKAITAEIKKGKYIYYHCANMQCEQRSKNIREEKIEEQILHFLTVIKIPNSHSELIIEALKESHADEKEFHEQSVTAIQTQISKIQTKLDKIYEDKLEGLIPEELWKRKHQEYTQEESRLIRVIQEHKNGSSSYMLSGVQLIELSQQALELYKKQGNTERRRLLRFMSSNYLLKGEEVIPEWNPAFKQLYKFRDLEKWRSGRDSNSRLAIHQHRLSRSAP